jgi:heme/copper-type cytochrome/quinol oxidase subunit 2
MVTALSFYTYCSIQYGTTASAIGLPMGSIELSIVKIIVLYYVLSVVISIGVLVFLFFSFFRMSRANRTICLFFFRAFGVLFNDTFQIY